MKSICADIYIFVKCGGRDNLLEKNYYIFSDNNDLGPEGAICIRNLVQENRSIKNLSLRSNEFVDSDCLELFEGIKAMVYD